ncbi:MAG: hypothetical protein QXL15_03670 [Candidatus Korarchaeota archaeon]
MSDFAKKVMNAKEIRLFLLPGILVSLMALIGQLTTPLPLFQLVVMLFSLCLILGRIFVLAWREFYE